MQSSLQQSFRDLLFMIAKLGRKLSQGDRAWRHTFSWTDTSWASITRTAQTDRTRLSNDVGAEHRANSLQEAALVWRADHSSLRVCQAVPGRASICLYLYRH
mmetsp:Transcript_39385/g.125014  ORF Transcript_39385/g.125014 Transcript_39385/m.125014 type:complete len:102 (+) Transcript_39385:1586-1891(+)